MDHDAEEKQTKGRFRRLARQQHPDDNAGDTAAEERFKVISEACEVLSDPEKRQKYDRLGQQWSQWRKSGRRPGDFSWGQWTTQRPAEDQGVHVRYATAEHLEALFGGGSPFSDIFSQVLAGTGAAPGAGGHEYQPRPRRDSDDEHEVEISLYEAYHGTERVLQTDGRQVEVLIPPGSRADTGVRLAGEGGPGIAGGSGDLYPRARIRPDSQSERRGDDLHTDVAADLYTAVLGGEAQVPTLTDLLGSEEITFQDPAIPCAVVCAGVDGGDLVILNSGPCCRLCLRLRHSHCVCSCSPLRSLAGGRWYA